MANTLFKVGLSAYSNEPQNLFLKGQTSVGKTHASVNTIKYFPRGDVWLIGSLSPKALVHQHGVLIDKNGDPIFPLSENASEEGKEEYKERLKGAKRLIELQGKIMVFLEAPQRQTYEMLRPILSHDTWEHEHKFAESTPSGIHTNTVVIRGWPATIFCTTEADFLEDLVTRSLTVTPEMSEEKYRQANILTAEREEVPLGDSEIEGGRRKLRRFIQTIKEVSRVSKIAIPFATPLAEAYPHEKPRDMRDFKKFLTLIKMNTLIHGFERPITDVGGEKLILSTIGDLVEALGPFKEVFMTTRTGVSKEVIDVYKEVFIPLKGESPGYGELIEQYANVRGDPISREWFRTKFVKPLEHLGWVDSKPDPDDKRRKIIRVQKEEIKTFKSLCKVLVASITRETGKEWLRKVSKIPRLNLENEYKVSFYKSLMDFQPVEFDHVLDKIVNYKGNFDFSKNAGNGEKAEKDAEKTKQRHLKANQQELERNIKIVHDLVDGERLGLNHFLDKVMTYFRRIGFRVDRKTTSKYIGRLRERGALILADYHEAKLEDYHESKLKDYENPKLNIQDSTGGGQSTSTPGADECPDGGKIYNIARKKREENVEDRKKPDTTEFAMPTIEHPSVSNIKDRLWKAFGIRPFKSSELLKYFSDDELPHVNKVILRMKESGKIRLVPMETGLTAWKQSPKE